MKIGEVQFGLSTIIDQETIHCVVIGAHQNLAIWKRPMPEFCHTICRKKWSPCLKTSHQLSYYRDARNFGQSSNRSYHQVPLPKRGICLLEMPRYCSLLCNYAVKGWKRQQSCSVSLQGHSLRKSSPAVCQYDWQKKSERVASDWEAEKSASISRGSLLITTIQWIWAWNLWKQWMNT